MPEQHDELSLEEYQSAREQLGTRVQDALDRHIAKMGFNVLHAYDLPHSVRGYLTHARTLGEVVIIWAVAHGYVELTEKGRDNIDPSEIDDEEESPEASDNVVELFPDGGQYL